MKEILITNDDGYESEAMHALIEVLRPLGHITVVAPASEKSSCGHGLTITKPLKLISVGDDFYKLDDGSPADCVYLAFHALYGGKLPDLVVSGINRGANLGEDTTYSGTVAAAMEAVLHGAKAIAISQFYSKTADGYTSDLALAKKCAFDLVRRVLEGGYPLGARQFLNVNVPNISVESCKGYRVTRASSRIFKGDAQRHTNPRGEEYFWLGLHPFEFNPTENGDYEAIEEGYISITPMLCDLTAHGAIEAVKNWL